MTTTIYSWARCFLVLCLVSSYLPVPVFAASGITAIWANTGEDKVAREELRATQGKKVTNSVWDGTKISVFGARNEVVGFNIVLEAGSAAASNISVSFNSLSGPSGSSITSSAATGNGVFNWVGRNIELFYVRYLQIKGVSRLVYEHYDERHVPQRFRRPYTGAGNASGTWLSRPDHDKFYPDIAVPLELVKTFTIAGGSNQSIWVDIFIPKTATPGNYIGQILVQQGGTLVGSIPVALKVYNFTLPDTPSSKTMLVYTPENIRKRYFNVSYIDPVSAQGTTFKLIRDRHYLLAHRHRLSLIGDSPGDCNSTADRPCPESVARLDGSLFTTANGYDGPGVQTGNNIYSIGTYGSWSWSTGTQADMHLHTDAWETWFSQNAPTTERFLYLIDESNNAPQIQTWSQWILNNPGPGRQLKSMATIPLPTAASQCPSLDIPTSAMKLGITSSWEPKAAQYTQDARKRFYMYNGARPASGSHATEDDGIALRELAWGQYKKHINRWFFWETTYYNNYQGGMGETNVFQKAMTFGTDSSADSIFGRTGWNYANGDGVLLYPGTDLLFPTDSYGVNGPFASLRLKYWRRGVQDVDYLTMASAINPVAVQTLVNQMIPKVLWEYGVDNPNDPTYVTSDISWSNNPDVWEAARLQLANIIAASTGGGGTGGGGGGGGGTTDSLPAPTLSLPSTLPVNAQITAGYPAGYSITAFQWSFVPAQVIAQAGRAASLARATASNFMTSGATARLADMNLSPGYYLISVMAIDSNNNSSPAAQAYVNLVLDGLGGVRAFPNPWRADQSYARQITFDQLPDSATVQIFTVSGHSVKKLNTLGSTAIWDLTTDSGDLAASGLYLYLISAPDGQQARGKLAIIK